MIYKIKLMDEELVQRPKEEPLFITLYSFGWLKPRGEKPRSRPTLLPPDNIRALSTGVEIQLQDHVLFYHLTPPSLSEQGIEVVGLHRNPDTREMMVRVVNYTMSPIYLQHGTPLVRLALLAPIKLQGVSR